MAKLDPEISKVLHDVKNTYQALLFHFDEVDGEGFSLKPEDALAKIHKDLALIKDAEQAIGRR